METKMKEYFYEAVEIFEPDAQPGAEPALDQTEYIDPIERVRLWLIDHGITDFEEQKPILHRAFQDLEDPGPTG